MKKALLTVFVAALMVSVALVPFAAEESAAEQTPAVKPTGSGTGITFLDNILCDVGMGYIIWGNFLRYLGGGSQFEIPTGDSDEVKEFGRKVAASYTAEDLTAIAVTAAALIDNNAQTWDLSQSYMDRAAEISAGTLWSSGGTYDPETILVFASIYKNVARSQGNTDAALASAIDNVADRVGVWAGTDYSSIGVTIRWDGGSTQTANESAKLVFSSVVTSSQGHGRVFLSSEDGTAVIWALDGAGQITGDDGQTIYLSAGRNTVSASSGWYTLSSGHYAGPFLPTVNNEDNSAVCQGGAVIAVDGSVGYVTVNGSDLRIRWNGADYTSSYLKYRYTTSSGTYETQTLSGGNTFTDSLANLVRAYSEEYDTYKKILARSAQAGQVMWSLSAAANEANILLSPSAISPQLTDVNIDATQAYALYVSALSQISNYYTTYNAQLSADQTKVSSQSLQLYCKGTVYNANGTVLASDVVFTPYVYTKNMTVYSGQMTTFNQDGILMIWTSSGAVPAISDFTESDVTAHKTLVMPKGSYFLADEVSYNGDLTNAVTLTVKEIAKVDVLSGITHKNISAPKVLKASTLVMIIMIELAAIFALLGISIARHPLTFVVAIVILLAGIFFPEEIAKLLLGWLGS